MGSYNFSWSHPAEEVFVTGTFDNWGKTVKLDANGPVHEKTVTLPETGEKILYKFVADGVWQYDHTAKSEEDDKGNLNNVLYPEDLKPSAATHSIATVAPGATTLALAGGRPLTKDTSEIPGAFPGEPAEQTFSVNPIPASAGTGNPVQLAPGDPVPHPSTINNNNISSLGEDDPSLIHAARDLEEPEQTFSVNPIPATGGIGNPVQLQPGEPVPASSTLTANTVESNVKLDQASYEKSDAVVPAQPAATASTTDKDLSAAVIAGLGPQTTNLIPESSLGMGNDVPPSLDSANLSSVGAGSTTAALAGQVPLEPRGVPEVVTESQEAANASPEAAANPTAVLDKSEVEQELKERVPEEPATSTTTTSDGTIAASVAGGLAAVGAAAAGTAAYLREKTTAATGTDPVSILPQSVQNSVNSAVPAKTTAAETTTASTVPPEVTESVKEANVSPEAAANPVAVQEKSATENELLSKVKESAATSESAPAASTAAATAAVPDEVTESIEKAGTNPEAAANPAAVQEKSAAEQELLSKVKETQAAGEPAPTVSAATATTAPTTTSSTGAPQLADPVGGGLPPITMDTDGGLNAPASSQAKVTGVQDSRDVSPMTSPTTGHQNEPIVTTGVGSATAPTTSKPVGTPRKGAGESSNSTPQKRNSFMERLRGTPESSTSTGKEPGSEKKKKGFLSKIKEKFKS